MTDTVSRFDTVKAAVSLREYAEAHLERGRDGKFVCPACGSGGHGTANSDSAFSITNDGMRWTCFSCGRSGDVFDLAGIVNGTEVRIEQLKAVEEWAGTGRIETAPRKATTKAKAPADYSRGRDEERRYIEQCRTNIDGSEGMAYLEARGFTHDEIMAAGIGYDPAKKRVVIPFSTDPREHYHIDRDVTGKASHKYEKPATHKVGPQPVHNVRALESDVVFVVEGALDALAVEACGYAAMALFGTSCRNTVTAMIEGGYKGTVVLMLDNDEAGRKAQMQMAGDLERAGIIYMETYGGQLDAYKDAAEALQANRTALTAFLEANATRAREAASYDAEGRYRAAMERLRVIDPAITAMDIFTLSDYEDPIPTGLTGLDRALDGGFRSGVVVLGAVSSLGKTTFTVQVADHIAASGRPVLFVTIEQSAKELVLKSLSRIMKVSGGECVTTRMIMDKGTRDAWGHGHMTEVLDAACAEYASNIAPNMHILEGVNQPRVSDIAEAARTIADHDGTAPVVFIDYLQLLAPQSDRDTDKQAADKNMMSLRQLARDMGTTVVVISSLNRSSYSGTISLDSFKESGGIEYGADVLLGLQPRDMAARLDGVPEAKKKSEADKIYKQFKAAVERPTEIKVLKQRNGSTPEDGIPVTFLPACSLFIDSSRVQGRRYVV